MIVKTSELRPPLTIHGTVDSFDEEGIPATSHLDYIEYHRGGNSRYVVTKAPDLGKETTEVFEKISDIKEVVSRVG